MYDKLRKWRNTLRISGIGTIVFSLWSIIKFLMMMFVRHDTIDGLSELLTDTAGVRNIVIIVMVVQIVLDFSLRLKVGLSAIAVSKGKQRGAAYLVIDAVLILSSLLTLIAIVYLLLSGNNSLDDSITSLIVEITCLYVAFDLFRSAVGIRQYTK